MTGGDVLLVDAGPGRVLVVLTGFIELADVPDLKAALLEATRGDGRELVLDLGAARWISSPGLGVLVGTHRRIVARGGLMVLWRPQRVLAANLSMLGLDRVVPVVHGDEVPFTSA